MNKIKNIWKSWKNLAFYLIKWWIICTLISLCIGIVVAFFLRSLSFVTNFRTLHPSIVLALPITGLVFSYLYTKWGQNASKGNNLIIDVANGAEENIPLRLVPLTVFGTIFTHLTGGSVGREGTATQSGGAIAYQIGRFFDLSSIEKQWCIMCGISAGFSAVFGTPLAGTLFAMEVAIIGTIRTEALIPVFYSSLLANSITELFNVKHSHYAIQSLPQMSIKVFVLLFICAMFFGLLGFLFEFLRQLIKKVYQRYLKNPILINTVGGIVIILATIIAQTDRFLGLSLPMIDDAFKGTAHTFDFLGKLIFTTLSLGCGFQGGEVTPLFGIGATAGSFLHNWINLPVSFLAALGFIGVFAAATNTPITCFVMGIELFGSDAAIYLLFITTFSYLFSGHHGIYSTQKILRPKYWTNNLLFKHHK